MRKLKLLMAACALMFGGMTASAYTTEDLTSAGWTQVTDLSSLTLANNYFVFVDAGASSTAIAVGNPASADRPVYTTLANPFAVSQQVWILAKSESNYTIQSYVDNKYFVGGSAGWNDSMSDASETGDFTFTANEGKYTIARSTGNVGPWNNDNAVKLTDGYENVAVNKSADQAPGFYVYTISRTAYEAGRRNGNTLLSEGWTQVTEAAGIGLAGYYYALLDVSEAGYESGFAMTGVTGGRPQSKVLTDPITNKTQSWIIESHDEGKFALKCVGDSKYFYCNGAGWNTGFTDNIDTDGTDFTFTANDGKWTLSNEKDGSHFVGRWANSIFHPFDGENIAANKEAGEGKKQYIIFSIPTIAGVAKELPADGAMEADTWYYVDIAATADNYTATSTTLENIVYTTDGTILLKNSSTVSDKFKATDNSLSATRYYVKSSSANKLEIGVTSYSYIVGTATPSIADNAYLGSLTTIDFTFNDAGSTDPGASFAILKNSAKAILKKGTETVKEGTLTLNEKVLTATFDGVTLDLNSTYTVSVDGGVVGYEGQQSNEAISLTYHTGIIAEGLYYLQKKDEQKYLGRGGSYGTEAVVSDFGISFDVSIQNDGNYYLKNHDHSLAAATDKYLTYTTGSIYTDQTPYGYTLEATNGGYYLRPTSEAYLTSTTFDTGIDVPYDYVSTTTSKSDAIVWSLISKEKYAENLTTLRDAEVAAAANKAGISATTVAGLKVLVGSSLGAADMTSSIKNAESKNNMDNWTQVKYAPNGQKDADANGQTAEIWAGLGGVQQVITGLEAGLYRVSVHATWRPGGKESGKNAGNEINTNAWVYANTATSSNLTQLKSWYEGGATIDSRSDMAGSGDTYLNEVFVYVSQGEDLTIGLASPTQCNGAWLPFFGWSLAKLEKKVSVTGFELSQTSASLTTGDGLKLEALNFQPEEAQDKTLTWISSDESVATVSDGFVTALKAGNAIITATTNDGSNISKTCSITVSDATAPSFVSDLPDGFDQGDFFIRNVGTGKFLGGANSWGTQASIIEHGIPFGFVKVSDGVYTLDSYTYNNSTDHFLGTDKNGNLFIDQGPKNITVTSLGNGKYALSSVENSYVTAKAGTTVVDNSATSSNASLAQWQFLSADDMLKNLKDGDTDATFLLSEANISRNLRKSYNQSAWKGTYSTWKDGNETKHPSGFAYGGADENQCGETFGKATDSYQTIAVPNGTYKVRVQGFYRADEGSEGASYLYANVGGEDITQALKTLGTEGDANNMSSASALFSEGKYLNELEVTVTNNCLTVGVKTDATHNWTIWDNFELELVSGEFNVDPAIADGNYYLTTNYKSITRQGGEPSDGERNQGVIANENELKAKVTTNTAGISIISFNDKADGMDGSAADKFPIKERLFLSGNQVYTDGKRHVEKNYHHHYWAIEAVEGGYKLRNIEDGRYLAIKDGKTVTVTEDGAIWKFENENDILKNPLKAEIAKADAIDVEGNIGNKELQIPESSVTSLNNAISSANSSLSTVSNKEQVATACETLQQAEETFYSTLKAPAEGKLFTISLASGKWASNGVNFENEAMTYLAGDRSDMGGYNIKYHANANKNLAQAFTFTRVEGNQYMLSQIDADGNDRYLSTGASYEEGNTSQIRTVTDVEKALIVNVIPTKKEGVYNLYNTEAENFIGAQDAGVYTVYSHIDFKITETTKPSITVNTTDAGWGTIMLPFAVSELPAGVKAYSCAAVDGNKLTLAEVTTLAANKPYIIEGAWDETLTGDAQGTKLTYTYDGDLLTGVYADTDAPVGSYVLQKNNNIVGFYKVADDKQPTVGANHAFLTVPASNPEARVYYLDNATAINAIEALTSGKAEIYNAAGARQNRLQKGVNIIKSGDKTVKVMVK